MEYIKKNKILLIIYILLFIVYIVSTVISSFGLFSDTPNEFFGDFHHIMSNDGNPLKLFTKNFYDMPRYCSWVVHRLIYLLFYPIFNNSVLQNLNLYVVSLVVMPFVLVLLNFLLARRTKRFDIAIWAFAFYSLFNLLYIVWFCRELQVAVLIQFLFLQCMLSKQKNTKLDNFIYIVLLLSLFQSFENMIILGFILFIYGLITYLKNKEYKIKYLLTGIVALLISLFIMSADFLSIFNNNQYYQASYKSLFPWSMYMNSYPPTLIQTPVIISYIAILIIVYFALKNREFCKKDFLWAIPLFIVVIGFIYCNTKFIPNPTLETCLFLLSVFMLPIVFLIILICDYYKKTFSKKFLNNLIKVACIIGIMQFVWQINSSVYCYKYTNLLKEAFQTSDKPFIMLHVEKTSKIYNYAAHSSYFIRSFILSEDHNIKSLFIPDINHRDVSPDKKFEFRDTYFDEDKNALFLMGQYIDVKNQYWNLTEISNIFKELKITNPEIKYSNEEFVDILSKNDKLFVLNID